MGSTQIISSGSLNQKVLARFRSHVVGCRLRLIDRYAWFQSAHRMNRERITLGGIVAQAIGDPEVR